MPFLAHEKADIEAIGEGGFDLALACTQLRALQDKVDGHHDGGLYGPTALLDEAIRRYINIWLPLLSEAPDDVPLLPPLDVMWVWTLHMLAPIPYFKDCERGWGRRLPRHFMVDEAAAGAAVEAARQRWAEAAPDEKWEPPVPEQFSRERGSGLKHTHFEAGQTDGPHVHYNLRGSSYRQAQAMWNMSRPQFARKEWMVKAVRRYAQFLRLMWHRQKKQMLVPTYDIDLAWHAHMSYPQLYAKHSILIAGFVVNHDDGFNDRSGALPIAAGKTRDLWVTAPGTDRSSTWHRPGGMYRGIARPGFDCDDYPVRTNPYPARLPNWSMKGSAEVVMARHGPPDAIIADRCWADDAVPGWEPLHDGSVWDLEVSAQIYAVRGLPFPFSQARSRQLTAHLHIDHDASITTSTASPITSTPTAAASTTGPSATIGIGCKPAVFSLPAGQQATARIHVSLTALDWDGTSTMDIGKSTFMPILSVLLSRPSYVMGAWLPLASDDAYGGTTMIMLRVSARPVAPARCNVSVPTKAFPVHRLHQELANEVMFLGDGTLQRALVKTVAGPWWYVTGALARVPSLWSMLPASKANPGQEDSSKEVATRTRIVAI